MYFEITLVYHTDNISFLAAMPACMCGRWLKISISLLWHLMKSEKMYFLNRICNSNINQLFKSVDSEDNISFLSFYWLLIS